MKTLIIVLLASTIYALPTKILPGRQPNTAENLQKLKNLGKTDNAEYYGGQFEGDIVLTAEQAASFRQMNGLITKTHRWANNTVPYVIQDKYFTFDQQQYIIRGLTQLELSSCLKFVPWRGETDYVEFIGENSGCWSHVGRAGGKQELNLTPYPIEEGCFRLATIMHEMLHALGFYHMQSTHDRDNFVTIMWDNIQEGTQHNFEKYEVSEVTDFEIKYDYDSVMHYGAFGFSKNGEPTIVPANPKANIGQRIGLSRKDIEKLNRMYECPIN